MSSRQCVKCDASKCGYLLVQLVLYIGVCIGPAVEEITAGWVREWKDKPYAELCEEFIRRGKDMKRSYFKPKVFLTTTKNYIDTLNASGKDRQWQYQHLVDGYQGFNYTYTEGEVVLGYSDVIRMWGLSKFLVFSATHSKL